MSPTPRSVLAFCVCVVSFAILSSGCSSYQTKVGEARHAIEGGDSEKAAKLLEPLANQDGKDQLVYMLDYATALQDAKHYAVSAKMFERAGKIADVKDYHSISNIAGAALLSEGIIQYKGDNFEKVMINGVNALNYLEMGQLDEALVEAKLLNQKLMKFKTEAGLNYDQNPYAFYLSAMIWEAQKKWDDAYLDYKSAYEVDSSLPNIREDLVRTAMKAQRPDDIEKYKKEFPAIKKKPEWDDKKFGEIILVYQQGWGPRKEPRPGAPRFPILYPVHSFTQRATLDVDPMVAGASPVLHVPTDEVFSVERVAIKTLNDDYGRLVASRVGGVVTKAIVSDQLRQKNEILGLVSWIALNVADQADLRQWSTLPQTIQVARLYVPPGFYKVHASGLTGDGSASGEAMNERQVEIRAGHKAFVTWRSVH